MTTSLDPTLIQGCRISIEGFSVYGSRWFSGLNLGRVGEFCEQGVEAGWAWGGPDGKRPPVLAMQIHFLHLGIQNLGQPSSDEMPSS